MLLPGVRAHLSEANDSTNQVVFYVAHHFGDILWTEALTFLLPFMISYSLYLLGVFMIDLYDHSVFIKKKGSSLFRA